MKYLFKYGLVGILVTVLHIIIASSYILFINDSVFQSNIIGFLIAYVFSYFMQSKFVFEQTVSIKKAVKYFMVQFASLTLAILTSQIFDSYNSYFKTLIVAGLLPLITFIVHKIWTFRD